MTKPNVEVIEVELGIDVEAEVNKVSKEISGKTKEMINIVINEAAGKREEVQKKESARLEFEQKIDACYELIKTATQEKPVSSGLLIETSGAEDLSGLMVRMGNRAKKDNLKIEKRKQNGKNSYFLKNMA